MRGKMVLHSFSSLTVGITYDAISILACISKLAYMFGVYGMQFTALREVTHKMSSIKFNVRKVASASPVSIGISDSVLSFMAMRLQFQDSPVFVSRLAAALCFPAITHILTCETLN